MKPLANRPLRISIIVLLGLLFLVSAGIAMRSFPSNAEPIWSLYGNKDLASCGSQLDVAGDVNGDGYSDVLIGTVETGANIFAYYGSESGLLSTYQWSVSGSTFASAGDVNGDGFDDVLIGRPSDDNRGRALVYYGSVTGLGSTPDWIVIGLQVGENFGSTVSSAGDVNGDGFDDVVISAPDYDQPQTSEGQIVIYYGSPGGLSATPAWVYEPDIEYGHIGSHMASGDANGDGYSDIAVEVSSSHMVYVFYGSASGYSSTPDWTYGGLISSSLDLSLKGDLNHDDYEDLVIASYKDGPEPSVFVFLGSAGGLSTTPDYTLGDGYEGISFGEAVDYAGDLNRDGFDELIISAPYSNTADGAIGAVYVYLGSSGGITPAPDRSPHGLANEYTWFGHAISCAGDVNGDQYDEFLVGAPTQSSGGYFINGAAYLYSLPTPTLVPPDVYWYFLPVVRAPQP